MSPDPNAGDNRMNTNQTGINPTQLMTDDPSGFLVPPSYMQLGGGNTPPATDYLSLLTSLFSHAANSAPTPAAAPQQTANTSTPIGAAVNPSLTPASTPVRAGDAIRTRMAQLQDKVDNEPPYTPQKLTPFTEDYPGRDDPVPAPQYDYAAEHKNSGIALLVSALGGILGGKAVTPFIGQSTNAALDNVHNQAQEQYGRAVNQQQVQQQIQDKAYGDKVNSYNDDLKANIAENTNKRMEDGPLERAYGLPYVNADKELVKDQGRPEQLDAADIKTQLGQAVQIQKDVASGKYSTAPGPYDPTTGQYAPSPAQVQLNQVAQIRKSINDKYGTSFPTDPISADGLYNMADEDKAKLAARSQNIQVQQQGALERAKLVAPLRMTLEKMQQDGQNSRAALGSNTQLRVESMRVASQAAHDSNQMAISVANNAPKYSALMMTAQKMGIASDAKDLDNSWKSVRNSYTNASLAANQKVKYITAYNSLLARTEKKGYVATQADADQAKQLLDSAAQADQNYQDAIGKANDYQSQLDNKEQEIRTKVAGSAKSPQEIIDAGKVAAGQTAPVIAPPAQKPRSGIPVAKPHQVISGKNYGKPVKTGSNDAAAIKAFQDATKVAPGQAVFNP